MNTRILLSTFIASLLLMSCSSSKRMASTVDDLYYSPTPEYVNKEREEKNEKEIDEQREENFLRNKVRNRNRWQRIDDFSYWNDTRYNFNHCGCNNTFTNWNTYYNGWINPYTNLWVGNCGNTWNNPFYTFVPYIAPTVKPINTNWASNVKSFNNNNYNNNNMTYNPKAGYSNNNNTATNNPRTSRPSTNGGFFNNAIRVFSGSSTPSSNAGGKSGGFNSSGSSSSSTPRAPRTKN